MWCLQEVMKDLRLDAFPCFDGGRAEHLQDTHPVQGEGGEGDQHPRFAAAAPAVYGTFGLVHGGEKRDCCKLVRVGADQQEQRDDLRSCAAIKQFLRKSGSTGNDQNKLDQKHSPIQSNDSDLGDGKNTNESLSWSVAATHEYVCLRVCACLHN